MADDLLDLAEGRTRGKISLPEHTRSPWWELGRRLLAALSILVGTVLLVYLDRKGYADNNDPTPAGRAAAPGAAHAGRGEARGPSEALPGDRRAARLDGRPGPGGGQRPDRVHLLQGLREGAAEVAGEVPGEAAEVTCITPLSHSGKGPGVRFFGPATPLPTPPLSGEGRQNHE